MTDKQTHTTEDMYRFFKKKYPDSDVTFLQFRYTIGQFNKKLVDALLEGKTINLGKNLGRLRIRRIERNFETPRINHFETQKLKAQGIDKTVYFTDPYYFRFGWEKKYAKVKNKSVYKFKPTGGPSGNRKKLSRLLREDEFAQLNFKP